jgi:UDP-3-O-[3-hydroxymyristoyl] N-acetylglucosamine deacetylase/3-hydroxyacyl-[acyl-carrier-protein] dehydratase
MQKQHTITDPQSLSGRGLFHGSAVNLTFLPAPENHGIVFRRVDLGGATVPAQVQHVIKRTRRTALKLGEATVDTCEHCLSAVAAHRIDNLIIELDGPEVPAMDGSSAPFFEALAKAGRETQDAARKELVVKTPVVIREDDAMVAALPTTDPGTQFVYELDYTGASAVIGRQLKTFDLGEDDYAREIAPSRTFSLQHEAEAAKKAGLFPHLTVDTALVIGDDGPLGKTEFRFPDEPVRHKMLDLIGDLYLLGAPVRGRIIAYKSGHPMNHRLVRELIKQYQAQSLKHLAHHESVLDVRRLFRMMPHRYPMLLVDRVVEIVGDQRAVGVKNVTINEPFFQGHYPNTPIMPGVLVVEAMAQLSGVLIGQSLEQVGKLPVLLSLDRVKLRKPVTPGDQLMLIAEAVKIRSRIAHMHCRAYVAEELAAEAQVKFMMVDDDAE